MVVIGGGDTGSDCVGSVIRRGCASVTQIELLPEPSQERLVSNPWPEWPAILRTSSSHHEGAKRLWSIGTKEFYGTDGRVVKVGCTRLAWEGGSFTEIKGADFLLDADLVLLSMGFVPIGIRLWSRGSDWRLMSGGTSSSMSSTAPRRRASLPQVMPSTVHLWSSGPSHGEERVQRPSMHSCSSI